MLSKGLGRPELYSNYFFLGVAEVLDPWYSLGLHDFEPTRERTGKAQVKTT